MSKLLSYDQFWKIASEKASQGNHLAYHPCCDVWTNRNSKIARNSHEKTMRWREIINSLGRFEGDLKLVLLQKMKENDWNIPVTINQCCSLNPSNQSNSIPAKTVDSLPNMQDSLCSLQKSNEQIPRQIELGRQELQSNSIDDKSHLSTVNMEFQIFPIANLYPEKTKISSHTDSFKYQQPEQLQTVTHFGISSGPMKKELPQLSIKNNSSSGLCQHPREAIIIYSNTAKDSGTSVQGFEQYQIAGGGLDILFPSRINQMIESKIDNLNRDIGKLQRALEVIEQENTFLRKENRMLQDENTKLLASIKTLEGQFQAPHFAPYETKNLTPDSLKHISTIRSAKSSILCQTNAAGTNLKKNSRLGSWDP